VPDADADVIARALQSQAQIHDFDPLTGVAIILHESHFNPQAISKNGEDYGLAQIRARYIGACKQDEEPLRHPSKACREVKKSLLDPERNIETMAQLITQNRKFCKKKVGSAAFARWLASYQGRNNARTKRWCKPGKGTWRVIETRKKLLSQLNKARKLGKKQSATRRAAQ
jgi:soluble lytic murein transglycosylase-like protein